MPLSGRLLEAIAHYSKRGSQGNVGLAVQPGGASSSSAGNLSSGGTVAPSSDGLLFSAVERRPVVDPSDTPIQKAKRCNKTQSSQEGRPSGQMFLMFAPVWPASEVTNWLRDELNTLESSSRYFDAALPKLGVMNASQLLSGSRVPSCKDLKFSGRMLSIVNSTFAEYKGILSAQAAIGRRITVLQGHLDDGTVPTTLLVKIPSLISSDSDVAELDDSVLSTLRESVTSASKAALEVMLAAKKKKKASLDQCMNAVDFKIIFKTVLIQSCLFYRTD